MMDYTTASGPIEPNQASFENFRRAMGNINPRFADGRPYWPHKGLRELLGTLQNDLCGGKTDSYLSGELRSGDAFESGRKVMSIKHLELVVQQHPMSFDDLFRFNLFEGQLGNNKITDGREDVMDIWTPPDVLIIRLNRRKNRKNAIEVW